MSLDPSHADEAMSGFADYLEPFCAGFIACRGGLSGDDGEAFMAAAMRAFKNSGSQRAKRFVETGDLSEIPALLLGDDTHGD